jgi:replicative DNA helicase
METLADWVSARGAELADQYQDKAAGFTQVLHCPTGLARLDAAGLLELGVCSVVLGHEGDGKSALGLQFLEGAARAGYKCQGYWPEDPKRFIADRVLSGMVGESASKLRRLKVDGDVPSRLKAATASATDWARRILVNDQRLESRELIEAIRRNHTQDTRLVLVDYAQVLSSETDEASVERVITRAVWDLNEFSKDKNCAVVLLSQVRTKVKERGRDVFDSWRRRNPTGPIQAEAVEGYRPLAGDGQWAPNALGQKARAVLSWFRPRSWMKMHGADVQDNLAELLILKSNYGPAMEVLKLHWDGPTTRITDPKG